MLHLVFCDNGMDRIKEILRPSDQVIKFDGEGILLVDTERYLQSLRHEDRPAEITGEEISNRVLAGIIEQAQAIKSTY